MAVRTTTRTGELGSLQRLIDDDRTPDHIRKEAQRDLEKLMKKFGAKDRAALHRALDAVLDGTSARARDAGRVKCPVCGWLADVDRHGCYAKHSRTDGSTCSNSGKVVDIK